VLSDPLPPLLPDQARATGPRSDCRLRRQRGRPSSTKLPGDPADNNARRKTIERGIDRACKTANGRPAEGTCPTGKFSNCCTDCCRSHGQSTDSYGSNGAPGGPFEEATNKFFALFAALTVSAYVLRATYQNERTDSRGD
jgi:hypothetical protein